ncbi:MAG TPA: hypothetical protein VFU47_02805, partial [Armatimonadota bacterium]|nr:hypothetical protein [Armatimonadota bacterium]
QLIQNQDRLSELIEAAQGTPPERAARDVETVREAQQLLDRNVTPQLVMERMFWALIAGPIPVRNHLFEEAYA